MLKQYLTKAIAAVAIVAASVAITAGCGEPEEEVGPEKPYKMPEGDGDGKNPVEPDTNKEDMPGKEGTPNPTG